ncbi:lipopolysaccharide biosynthesis protein [Marinobacter salarius]|uniref:lipopolysaccharide biosynthesis protein n=1 Tax=Marinobacter salarius TaxID=1420917 RepID=UPI001D1866BD|nr:lipopolysaccharide biosynthesis protein [Marinobacter salarius]MCC4282810.1 lipopolysaccharide biosynthesis protein [Marinobacter salarius]
MSLTERTTTGVFWNLSEQFAKRGISIAVTLLLAKFLVPEDFGLVAMMAVFLTLGQTLMDSGFREALIRLQNVTQRDYATAFYANLMLGLVSYGILYFVAPIIVQFYGEPRLLDLIRVASLTVIITSFQVVQVANLSREMNFKIQLKASFPAGVVSGTLAVCLAYLDMGAWALVAQMLLNATIHTCLLWVLVGWRPGWQFSWTSVREMYNFGYKLFLSGALNTIFQNLYVIVIAKIFSAQVAGLYFFAQKIKELIVQQLVTSIQKVTYPALASIQGDEIRLKQGYKKIVVLMSTTLFPGILFTAVVADPVFKLLLPEKWWPAVIYFQLLCVATVMLPLHSINLNILKVKGRSDLFLCLEVVKKSVNGLALLVTYRYGVHAILVGQIVTSVINYVPNSYFSSKLLGYGVVEQLKDFSLVLAISFVSAGLSFFIVNYIELNPALTILSAFITMLASFIGLSIGLNRKSFNVVIGYFITHLLKRPSRTLK